MIEPKIPKGFRDSLPIQEIKRKNFEHKLEKVFESYGFVPIDTPILEYTEVLLGKGGGETDKQIFHFTDNGGREVALRFDLTVPLARFVSANQNELSFPFKRYHIAKVFRGEKPQKGRYREFMQCDFDIVGSDNATSDYEILSMMVSSLKALSVGEFKIHISNRGLLNDFLKVSGIEDKNTDILRIIDKLKKIGMDKVKEELNQISLSDSQIDGLLKFIQPQCKDFLQTLETLTSLIGSETPSSQRMREIHSLLQAEGIAEYFLFDPSITRGLDYYTGVVFETFLDAIESIGSVCSGGRYNNLTGLYNKNSLPGVGSCVGIDRLIAAQEELSGSENTSISSCDLVFFSSEDVNDKEAIAMASILRKNNIRCDVYLGNKKAKEQYAYAQSKMAPFAITAVSDGKATVKNLNTRQIFEGLDYKGVIDIIGKSLSGI